MIRRVVDAAAGAQSKLTDDVSNAAVQSLRNLTNNTAGPLTMTQRSLDELQQHRSGSSLSGGPTVVMRSAQNNELCSVGSDVASCQLSSADG